MKRCVDDRERARGLTPDSLRTAAIYAASTVESAQAIEPSARPSSSGFSGILAIGRLRLNAGDDPTVIGRNDLGTRG